MSQLSLFPQEPSAPVTVTWNPWHGCTKVSPGCRNCYVYRRDAEYGKDSGRVSRTKAFDMPLSVRRSGENKYPEGTTFMTCFTSDFFHTDADGWRQEAWRIMKTRSDCFFYMITKRPERIMDSLPPDWGGGYTNVEICCTCEDQETADRRLPVYLSLPLRHMSVIHEPMLERIDIRPFLREYADRIECVTVGGESGPDARLCDYDWVLDTRAQCAEYGVGFFFHQTGARFKKGGRVYDIPRSEQHRQARKAGLDTC